jgi:hypothetical protein
MREDHDFMVNESLELAEPRAEGEAPPAPKPTPTARVLPLWFVALLVAPIVWCATAGAVGIMLLAYGTYNATLTSVLATLVALVAAVAATRRLGPRRKADHAAALAALVLVAASFALSSGFHSEHYLRDRDPAIYLNTGRAIARYHELGPKVHTGPFTAKVFGNPGGRYNSDFFPMLPVLLALSWSAGGDSAMLLVGPALGALGLLACFALASRVAGPRWGLLALAILAISAPQVWFSRDAFSELVVQVVVLGGLWLFLEARARERAGFAALAGALIASSALARIDSLAVVFGAILLVAAEWVRCDAEAEPVRARRVVAAFGAALIGVTLVTLPPTRKVAHGYIHALGAEYRQLTVAFYLGIVGLFLVVLIHRLRPGLGRRWAQSRVLFAAAVAASTAVFVWAYVWRPAPQSALPHPAPGSVPSAAVARATNEWHYTASLHWFSAYYGVIGLVVAFVGLVLLAARARRGNHAATAVFLVVVPVAVLYIARPSIQAGQPWAMRRYLPVVIPGVAIAMSFALRCGWRAVRRQKVSVARSLATVAVAVVAIGALAPTLASALPFATARAQHGAQAAVHRICTTLDNDSAVLVPVGRYLNDELPDALRMFCGVPAATASADGIDLPELARQWNGLGRRLVVATVVPDAVIATAPGSKVIGHFPISDDADPERIFDRAPSRFAPVPVDIWLVEIAPRTA